MLDEVAEQFEFQQLKTTTTTTSVLHPSFPTNTFHHIPLINHPDFNNNNNSNPSSSNSHSPHHQFSLQTQSNNLLFHSSISSLPHHSSFNFQIQKDHHQLQPSHLIDSGWTNDELLALFKIRSTIHNCFPDHLTWDHVSRKLAEVGFKKSAEKCKEKYEDENTSFSKIRNHNDFSSELQSLYQSCGADESDEKEKTQHDENSRDEDNIDIVTTKQCDNIDIVTTKQCDDDDDDKVVMEKSKVDRNRKRKNRRRDRFEMLKCFCETVVNKMMAQQEEIHNKLIQDMLKRDQEKLAREDEWRKHEMERMNMMAQEQAISDQRQATIIDFMNKYLSTDENGIINNNTTKACSSSQLHSQNPSSSETALLVPSTSSNNSNDDNNKNQVVEDKRRWPRDEVLALINLKCTTTTVINRSSNKNSIEENSNNNNKGTVWERISEGMSEMGYKRSAKRCKEKWENINKYFRKTKDGVVNKKKRSMDSRTCPYFYQLSCLYNKQQQGKVIADQNQLTSNSTCQVDDQPQAQSFDSP